MGSSFGVFNSMEDMNWQMNAVIHVNAVGGTGIKVRTRQPQARPHADNFVAQVTAPRRLRLQTKFSTANSGNGDESDSSDKEDKDEVQSAVTEATDATEENPVSDELLEESQLKNSSESRENVEKCSPHLRSRVKQNGESGKNKIEPSAIPEAASAKSVCSSTSLYIFGLLLVLVLFLSVPIPTWYGKGTIISRPVRECGSLWNSNLSSSPNYNLVSVVDLSPTTEEKRSLLFACADATRNYHAVNYSFIDEIVVLAEVDDHPKLQHPPERLLSTRMPSLQLLKKDCQALESIELDHEQYYRYNVKKFSLDKFGRSTILKGYDVLRRISDIFS